MTDTNPAPENTEFNFRDHVSDEFKEKYTEFKDIDSVMKGYDSLVTKMGSSISLPKEDAPKEEWDKFYSKLGRPESADKYDFSVPEYPNGFKPNEELIKGVKGILHEAGVPAKQAKQIAESYFNLEKGMVEKLMQDQEKALQEAETQMKSEWGAEYEAKLDKVNGFAKQYASEQDKEVIAKYGNDPAFIRLMNNFMEKFGEDKNTNKGEGADTSKESLLKRKSEIMDMKSPYWNPNDPAHGAVKDELRRINQQLVG